MVRRLLNLLTLLSLLLCVAVEVLRERSGRVTDTLRTSRGGTVWVLGSESETLWFVWYHYDHPDRRLIRTAAERGFSHSPPGTFYVTAAGPQWWWSGAIGRVWGLSGTLWESRGTGISPPRDKNLGPARSGGILASDGLLIGLFACLPLARTAGWAVRHVRARRRRGARLCVSCGYDLRGTPGRCPECGTIAAGGAA